MPISFKIGEKVWKTIPGYFKVIHCENFHNKMIDDGHKRQTNIIKLENKPLFFQETFAKQKGCASEYNENIIIIIILRFWAGSYVIL